MKKKVMLLIVFVLFYNIIVQSVFANEQKISILKRTVEYSKGIRIENLVVIENNSIYTIVSKVRDNGNNTYEIYKDNDKKPIYTLISDNQKTTLFHEGKEIYKFNKIDEINSFDLKLRSAEYWDWQYSNYTKSDLVGGQALIASILASFLGVLVGVIMSLATYIYSKGITEVYFTEKYRYIVNNSDETMKKERYIYSYSNSDRTKLIDTVHVVDRVAWE